MIQQLEQETLSPYAADATVRQEPQGVDRSRGAQVGRTIPAKWWNWLFNAVIKRLHQGRTDAQNMLTELQNVVTDAGIALDSADSTQMSGAVDIKNAAQRRKYAYEGKANVFGRWLNFNVNTIEPSYTDQHKMIDTAVFMQQSDSRVITFVCREAAFPHRYRSYISTDFKNGYWIYNGNFPVVTNKFMVIEQGYKYVLFNINVVISGQRQNIDNATASLDTPTGTATYLRWYTLIDDVAYIMSVSGHLLRADATSITDTGVTAGALGLPTSAEMNHTAAMTYGSETRLLFKVEAVKHNNKYYVGNLEFDGTSWVNVNNVHVEDNSYVSYPLSCIPRVLRDGSVIFIPYRATGPSYLLKSDGTTSYIDRKIIPYYVQDQVSDIVLTADNDELGYSTDGEHFDVFSGASVSLNIRERPVIEIDDYYIVNGSRKFLKDFTEIGTTAYPVRCRIGDTSVCVCTGPGGYKVSYDTGMTVQNIVSIDNAVDYSIPEFFIEHRYALIQKGNKIFFVPPYGDITWSATDLLGNVLGCFSSELAVNYVKDFTLYVK